MQNESIPLDFKEIAIIGATASGKSDFAIKEAERLNANILSIDSLSIYREIDIVSAKPSKDELNKVNHFGINEINPNEKFDVNIFINLYKKAKEDSIKNGKNLVIVGGTSFYLKTLFTGLSKMSEISKNSKDKTDELLEDLQKAYNFLEKLDLKYAEKIKPTDKYRVEKALNIFFETKETPSIWFQKNPPVPILSSDIPIFNLNVNRIKLRAKIRVRTDFMLKAGLLDEIKNLISKYGENINPMKAIGIKETIQFFNGEIKSLSELSELISIHTGQLAKRQETFNRTQFTNFNIQNI